MISGQKYSYEGTTPLLNSVNSYPDGPLEIKSLIRIDLPYQKVNLNIPIYMNTLCLKMKMMK